MFEPFQDRNPHFFGTVSLSWFVMTSISKMYSFNLFWAKPLRKKIWGKNLDFWKSYFQNLRWNWVFRTNMESNAAVTLHFPPKLFSWVVWSKTNWSYTFSKWISWQISSNWLFQRNVDSDLERAQTSEHCSRDPHCTLSNVWDQQCE